MKLVFVSGPEDPSTVSAGLRLMKQGHCVYFGQPCRLNLTPYASLLALMNEDNQWRMRWNMSDVEMIKRSDIVYMCIGWNKVDLCKMHMNLAQDTRKQILFEGVVEPRGYEE